MSKANGDRDDLQAKLHKNEQLLGKRQAEVCVAAASRVPALTLRRPG